jgi:hypothetical protein
LVVAANGPRAIRLALVKGDGWSTTGLAPFGSVGETWWTGVADAARRFDALAAEAEDLPTGFRRTLDVGSGAGPMSSVEQLHDVLGRAAGLGFSDAVLGWPRPSESLRGAESAFAGLGSRLGADGSLGV